MRVASIAIVVSIVAATSAAAQSAPGPSTTETSAAAADHDAARVAATGLIPEPNLIGHAVALANRFLPDSEAPSRAGFYPEFGNMIAGAGWLSVGPGYRRYLFGERAFVDGSAAISWRAYKMAQLRFELPKLASDRIVAGSQVRWQDLTQMDYFGIGPDSRDGARSQYRFKSTDVVGYGSYAANTWLSVAGTFGRLQQPTLSSPTGPFQQDWPDASQTFAHDPGVATQPSFLHGSASVTVDTRDYPGHPMRGGVYRAAFAGYSDRDAGQFSFQRYNVEGLQVVPIKRDTWILAMHGWAVFSSTSKGDEVPFYMLPAIGGESTLRGYDDYRFHDRNMLTASAESRWALFRDVDAVAFFDAGNVGPHPGDLNLQKTSWGGGLRLHARRTTFARVDVGHSVEGWHVFFNVDDPFALKRLSRRTADAPFAP